jgi:hypothetical protein
MPLDAIKFNEPLEPALLKIAEFRREPSCDNPVPFVRQLREMARKQKVRIASVQHLLAFVAKYPDVASQVSLEFPHDRANVYVYGSDRTLRWQPGSGGWGLNGITLCLVRAV